MIAIGVRIDTEPVRKMLERLAKGLTDEGVDRVVEREGFRVLRDIVKESPKHWFGQIRSGWRVEKPRVGVRIVQIDPARKSITGTSIADIAKFVDEGTANDGSGFIVPKRARFLYIPLKRRAAAGYQKGFVWGEDFILRSQVRGIRGRHFSTPVKKRAAVNFGNALLAHARKLAKGS